MSTNEIGMSSHSSDSEYTDWMGIAFQPNWIKYLRHEKRQVLCLADVQVAAIEQLVRVMFESRAICYANNDQQPIKSPQESNGRLDSSMHSVQLMCLRGLLTDRQEGFYIRNFHRLGKPSVFLAMRSRIHRHYLGVDEQFWAAVESAIERAAITADSMRKDAYWDKCDEVAFAIMGAGHRRNWERLQQCPSPPTDVPSLPAGPPENETTSISPVFDAVASLSDDLELDHRRPASTYFPELRTQRELFIQFVEVVRQAHAWITHRTEGPFLVGDERNEPNAPVGQTQQMFRSYAENFVNRGILGPAQEEKVLATLESDAN